MDPAPSRRGLGWLPLGCAAALAVWLYQPWHPRAFDVLDFSEFLPLLKAGRSVVDRFLALLGYYSGTHGRFNALSYAALAAKWSWLGADPLRWQWLRAVELLVIAVLAFRLLRRLAAGGLASALGACLLVFSYSAALPWVRLTMGEPLGLLCALIAALLATGLDPVRRSAGSIVAIGLALAAAILAKEMLIAWVPVVLLIGAARAPDGRLDRWRRDPQVLRFLVGAAVGALVAALAVLHVAQQGTAAGYSATYGQASWSAERLGELFQRQFLPWPITGQSDGMVMLVSALLFLGVIVAGMRAGLRDPAWRGHCLRVLCIGLGLPLAGTLLYVPWPVYAPFYGYPFLFGPALLLATSLTILAARGAWAGGWAAAAAVTALVLAVPHAVRLARTALAQQELMTALARALPFAQGADRIVVAVAGLPAQPWQGTGPSLTRYAVAQKPGLRLPPAEDMLCMDAGKLLAGGPGRVVLISISSNCGGIPGATQVIQSNYSYWRWQPPSVVRDSVRAEILLPPTLPR